MTIELSDISKLKAPTSNVCFTMTDAEWQAAVYQANTSPVDFSTLVRNLMETLYDVDNNYETNGIKLVRRMFHVASLSIFAKYSTLRGFKWIHQTPLEYQDTIMHVDYVATFIEEDGVDNSDWDRGYFDPDYLIDEHGLSNAEADEFYKSTKYSAYSDLNDFLRGFNRRYMLDIFGNNSIMTVTMEKLICEYRDPRKPLLPNED